MAKLGLNPHLPDPRFCACSFYLWRGGAPSHLEKKSPLGSSREDWDAFRNSLRRSPAEGQALCLTTRHWLYHLIFNKKG